MKFRIKEGKLRHIVDDDTGIEIFQRQSPDSLEETFFIFRDPSWVNTRGDTDIEIYAKWLKRFVVKEAEGQPRAMEEWYGLDIPTNYSNLKLKGHVKDRSSSVAEINEFIKCALTYFLMTLAGVSDPVVLLSPR